MATDRMTTSRQPEGARGGDALIVVGVLAGLVGACAWLYLNVRLDETARLIALVGMLVFMFVTLACLGIFLDWRRGDSKSSDGG